VRYAIFADVHSNLEAIEAVENVLGHEKIDKYICLGDIVGYGASPGECIKKVKCLASIIIAGNHDWAAAGKIDCVNFNAYARDAVLWTRRNISEEERNFLFNLPLVYESNIFMLAHGALIHPENFNYVLNKAQALDNMRVQKTMFYFFGHSHIPEIYAGNEEFIFKEKAKKIKISKANRYLVNVGSVGQPRDADARAAYCIFDTEKKTISIKRVKYDIEKAHDKILAAGLPPVLANRLFQGR